MHLLKATSILLVLMSFPASTVYAGPYTDDLSKCLVESTTQDDRVDLVRWMFAAASAHPAVQSFVSVSEEQLEEANKTMAALIERLLTESCKDITTKAMKYEGATTLQASFQVLGQVAGQELFSSPEVSAALSGMEEHFDLEALQALAQDEQPQN